MTRSWKDAEIAAVRAGMAARAPQPGQAPPTLEAMRAGADMAGRAAQLPAGSTVEACSIGGRSGERHTPANAAPGRTLLYLHGGGYRMGSALSHRGLTAALAHGAGAIAVSQDYRLAPEHPFPAALEDALAAYRELLDRGADPARLCIAGDSAGAGLALAVLMAARDAGLPQPGCAFLISPWADLSQSGRSYDLVETDPMISRAGLNHSSSLYLGSADPKNPLVSPAFGDFAGLAPLLIHVGSEEALLSDSLAVTEKAAFAGVHVALEVWPEMIHVWHMFAAQLSAGRRAIDGAGRWIAERLG